MDDSASIANRRPLKTRQWQFFQRLAKTLAAAGATPNAISVSSMVFAGGAGVTLAATSQVDDELWQRGLWLASAALMQLRLIANLIDGMVAIEGGQKSAVGELYNEAPDRVSDTLILIGAGLAVGGDLVLGMLAAILALFVAYVRALGASTGVGQVFGGPMAKPQRMALLTATCVFCGITPRSWQMNWVGNWGIVAVALLVIILGGVVTAIRRLMKIASLLKQKVGDND